MAKTVIKKIKYSKGWYVLKHLVGRCNYTAHKKADCGHLIKPRSKLTVLPKDVVYFKDLPEIYSPCSACAGTDRDKWFLLTWSRNFGSIEAIPDYMLTKRLKQLLRR